METRPAWRRRGVRLAAGIPTAVAVLAGLYYLTGIAGWVQNNWTRRNVQTEWNPPVQGTVPTLPEQWGALWAEALRDPNIAADLRGWRPVRVIRGLDFESDTPHHLYESSDGIGEQAVVRDPDNPTNRVQWIKQWRREGIATAMYDAATWGLPDKNIVVIARIRTRGIVRKEGPTEKSWMWGGKFMLQFNAGDSTYWEVANFIDRYTDWHTRILEQDDAKGKNDDNVWAEGDDKPRRYIIHVPNDAKDCQLHLGFRDAEGQIWFDDVGVFEVEPQTGPKDAPTAE